jgi:hypothetical protein
LTKLTKRDVFLFHNVIVFLKIASLVATTSPGFTKEVECCILSAYEKIKAAVSCRVARWNIFKPNIPVWVNFARVLQWTMLAYFMTICPILQPFDKFCANLEYFVVIWYIFPVLVCCTKKNMATLASCCQTICRCAGIVLTCGRSSQELKRFLGRMHFLEVSCQRSEKKI